MSDSLFAPAHLFPDGYYRLKEDVFSPLPARLTRSRRRLRGWARPRWDKGTEFKIASSLMVTVEFIGSTPKLSARQRDAVARALTAALEPIPALPGHMLRDTYTDAGEALDALFVLGKITLDDVREAVTALDAAGAIGQHARDLGRLPEPPPKPAGPEPRLGDVIHEARFVGTKAHRLYVNVSPPGMPPRSWKIESGDDVHDLWRGSETEPVVGHVADMIAEGLSAISAPRLPVGHDHDGTAVYCGDVLGHIDDPDDGRHVRLRIVGRAPSDLAGPCAHILQLSGPPVSFDVVSLRPFNKWRVAPQRPVAHFQQAYQAGAAIDPFTLD